MLEGDTKREALRSARVVSGAGQSARLRPRVHQFYDSRRLAGRSIARGLGGEGRAAWDIYLLYEKGSVWGEVETEPPMPALWAHQLEGSNWADAPHFRCGESLLAALRGMVDDITSTI